MAIQVKRDLLSKQVELGSAERIRLSLHTSKPPVPLPLPAPPDITLQIMDAMATDRRAAIAASIAGNEKLLAAIAAMKPGVPDFVNWNVSITKRDALGRISEVVFKPAKL